MNIYIMTRGRVGKQGTLKWIPKAWRDRTFLVCPKEEIIDHLNNEKVACIPSIPEVTNYSQKFQWIMNGLTYNSASEDTNEKVLIMDDDLVFSRKNALRSLVTVRDPEELTMMFELIEDYLDNFALVGVHPRQMGQNAKEPFVQNGRIICMQGINRVMVGNVKVDQYPILADVILNLTLLSRGQPNAILTTFFQDHGPCQAPGGCSIYRTPDMQHAAVSYLAKRWPDFVKVVERKPKVAKWMGDTRYEYTAQWKRLYAAGVAHLLDTGKVRNPDEEAARAAEAVE